MAQEDLTPEQRERMQVLKDVRSEAAAFRQKTWDLAQRVRGRRLEWQMAKLAAKEAAAAHEMAQWELEMHCGAATSEEKPGGNGPRQRRLPEA